MDVAAMSDRLHSERNSSRFKSLRPNGDREQLLATSLM